MGQMHKMDNNAEVQEYPEGRRCMNLGCGRPLSIYNPGPYCFQHTGIKIRDYNHSTSHPFNREYFLREDVGIASLCTSRETPGFDEVQREYQGEGIRGEEIWNQ